MTSTPRKNRHLFFAFRRSIHFIVYICTCFCMCSARLRSAKMYFTHCVRGSGGGGNGDGDGVRLSAECMCVRYLTFVLLPNKNIFYCDSVNNWNLLFLFVCHVEHFMHTNISRIKCEVKHSILTRSHHTSHTTHTITLTAMCASVSIDCGTVELECEWKIKIKGRRLPPPSWFSVYWQRQREGERNNMRH